MLNNCTVIAAGPILNDHIDKYHDYIDNSFTIATSPLILSNLKIDLQFYECADKIKFESYGNLEKNYNKLLSSYFNKVDAFKVMLQTGTLEIIQNTLPINIWSIAQPIYFSKLKYRNYFNLLLFFIISKLSSKILLSHSRSSLTTCLELGRILGYKDIKILGYDIFQKGYYFNYSNKLLKDELRKSDIYPIYDDDINRRNSYNLDLQIRNYIYFYKLLFNIDVSILK